LRVVLILGFSTDLERKAMEFFDVFEMFITNFYKFHLSNWEVIHEKHFYWHDITQNEFLPIMKPDIFYEKNEQIK